MDIITGDRVRCANCGTIYNKPPSCQIFWIGVPFRVEGMETCPKCGSNAADLMGQRRTWVSTTSCYCCAEDASGLREECERLRVQLAGCSVAALVAGPPAEQGSYGWSPAYQDVVDLRKRYEGAMARLNAIRGDAKDVPSV